MNNKIFISVSGFSASGSSALTDLLKEYTGTYECKAEIRLIQDPYGIRQLERNLTDDWNYITSAAAIRDFLWLCKRCGRSGGGRNPFARSGLSYEKRINEDFMKISKEYVENLSEFSFQSDYYCQKFKKPYPLYVYDRIALGIDQITGGKINLQRKKEHSYFSHPTHERFSEATKLYFEKLFSNYGNNSYIILDQAISVSDPCAINRYFSNGKLIIVDRDPRDMYVDDIINWGSMNTSDYSSESSGLQFCLRHKAMREHLFELPDNAMYLKFEDLILNYDESVKKIQDFTGLTDAQHIKKGLYLKNEVSKNNIGIWKKYFSQFEPALLIIEKELRSYCFE